MSVEEKVEGLVRNILEQKNGEVPRDLPVEASLMDGLGLDSLDLAELSMVLESEFGQDPYSDGVFPQTIDEICAYYESPDGESGA